MAQPNDRDEDRDEARSGPGDGTESGTGRDRSAETASDPGAGGRSESGTDGRTGDDRPEPTGGQSGHRTDPEPADSGPDRDPRDESVQVADEERRRKTSVVSGIVAVVGAWVAVSVFLFGIDGAAAWNSLLVGAVVFVAAGYNYYRQHNDSPLSVAIASLVAVLGIWLIVAVALFETTGGFFWNTAASGLLVAVLAGYNAYEARDAQAVATDRDVTS